MPELDGRQHPSVDEIAPARGPALDSLDGPPVEPTLSEHLDAYEANRPEETEEVDPETRQAVLLIVSVVLGVTGAIAIATLLAALAFML